MVSDDEKDKKADLYLSREFVESLEKGKASALVEATARMLRERYLSREVEARDDDRRKALLAIFDIPEPAEEEE